MPVFNINSLHGSHNVAANHRNATPKTSLTGDPSDAVSYLGQVLQTVHKLPEIRHERVVALKAAIARGDYDNDERMDRALENLLAEMG